MAWPNDGTSGVLHLARHDAYVGVYSVAIVGTQSIGMISRSEDVSEVSGTNLKRVP